MEFKILLRVMVFGKTTPLLLNTKIRIYNLIRLEDKNEYETRFYNIFVEVSSEL